MENIKIKKTVLVVDDMPMNLTTIKSILRSNNEYGLYSAKSGPEALSILERNIIDLMLLDIEMPDMTGFELFAKIQENPFYNGIPIIFVTATATPDIIKKATEMKAKDYIVKPVKADVLLKKVNSVFESGKILESTLAQRLDLLQDACKKAEIDQAKDLIVKIQPERYTAAISLNLKRISVLLHNSDTKQAVQKIRALITSLQS